MTNLRGDKDCAKCGGAGVIVHRVRRERRIGMSGGFVFVEVERQAIPPGTPPMDYLPPTHPYPVWAVESGECECSVLARQHDALLRSTNQDGVPVHYDKYSWRDFDDQSAAREAAREFVREDMRVTINDISRPGLLFVGATGTHKTCLAYMIYRQLLAQGVVGAWWLAQKLIEAEQATYDDKFSGDREVFQKACRTRLLVLDDLGDKRPSGAVIETTVSRQEIMFKLFEHREAKGLPTIATTNLKKGELYQHFGDRVASRILGLCHIIPMTGTDSRVNPKEDK